MVIDPKKTTIGQVVDNPQLKQEFEAYINNSLYGQPTKPATPRRRVTSTAPSTMSVEEAERIMASVPKGTPLSDIVKNPVYAEAFRVHMNHGFTPDSRKAQPSTTSRVNKSVADLTEDEFQQSIDDAISIVNKRRADINEQKRLSRKTGATVVSSLGTTSPKGEYTPAGAVPSRQRTQPAKPAPARVDDSEDLFIKMVNDHHKEMQKQQELSDRLNMPVKVGKNGVITTPHNRPLSQGEPIVKLQPKRPKTAESSFEALKAHAEHGRVGPEHVGQAAGIMDALRRARNESEINQYLDGAEGIYYTKPLSNEDYKRYMDFLQHAMSNGDIDAIRRLQKHLYMEHGVRLRRPAMHTTPLEGRHAGREELDPTRELVSRPHTAPKKTTVKKSGRSHVFKPTAKQVTTTISLVLLVTMLMTMMSQCRGRDEDVINPSGSFEYADIVTPTPEYPETTTRPEYTTPEVTDQHTITPAPKPEFAHIDFKTLKVDMQNSNTMSSKGAVQLSYAVVNEIEQLCTLANEKKPAALDEATLTALMFTENGFRTVKTQGSWVGATQVGKDAILQQIERAERFYNLCIKEINKETNPAVKSAKMEQLESNALIQIYLSGASVNELFERCKTDEKLAALIAGSALLDFAWRYDGSMSKMTAELSTLRAVAMFNAGEGNVTSNEKGGAMQYGWYEYDAAKKKDVATMMDIHLDEYPTLADLKDSAKVAHYYDKFQLKDPHNKGKLAVLKGFMEKNKEMYSYMAKVSTGADIVRNHIANGTIDRIYDDLDENNTRIGANENYDPSNFTHYATLDDLGGSNGYVNVDSAGFEKYARGQGQTPNIDLEQAHEY